MDKAGVGMGPRGLGMAMAARWLKEMGLVNGMATMWGMGHIWVGVVVVINGV